MNSNDQTGAWANTLAQSLTSDHQPMVFDEEGLFLATGLDMAAEDDQLTSANQAQVAALCGSWSLKVKSKGASLLCGVMRIYALEGRLRAAGDLYLGKAHEETWFHSNSLVIGEKWYPQFSQNEYQWYFYDRAVSYLDNSFSVAFHRMVWDGDRQEFSVTDQGWFRLGLAGILAAHELPRQTVLLKGKGIVGGSICTISAVKTSDLCRGCNLSIHTTGEKNPLLAILSSPEWPNRLKKIFASAGMDLAIEIETEPIIAQDRLNLGLVNDLNARINSVGEYLLPNQWRSWLVIGSKWTQGTAFGFMFDFDENPRQAAMIFLDSLFPTSDDLTDQALWEQPARKASDLLLRVACHELGHVFNLVHPYDEHHNLTGITYLRLMTTTDTTIKNSTATNPFPGNLKLNFHRHNLLSLARDPDPQVKPGWKCFGWGHATCGLIGDDLALASETPTGFVKNLRLELSEGQEAIPGRFFYVQLKLHNLTEPAILVPNPLDLGHHYLTITLHTPTGEKKILRDPLIICEPLTQQELIKGSPFTSAIQLTYCNRGITFDRRGKYRLQAELCLPRQNPGLVSSNILSLEVGTKKEEKVKEDAKEEDLITDPGKARVFALGRHPNDETVENWLITEMNANTDPVTALASGLVLANTYLEKQGKTPFEKQFETHLKKLLNKTNLDLLEHMVQAVLSPAESKAEFLEILTALKETN